MISPLQKLRILAFQADVMAELEKDATVPKSPIAIANWTSSVEGESGFIKLLTCCPCSGTPREAKMLDVVFQKNWGRRVFSWFQRNRIWFKQQT
jgi:hypothetical protein